VSGRGWRDIYNNASRRRSLNQVNPEPVRAGRVGAFLERRALWEFVGAPTTAERGAESVGRDHTVPAMVDDTKAEGLVHVAEVLDGRFGLEQPLLELGLCVL
jgi:hypothetical protein